MTAILPAVAQEGVLLALQSGFTGLINPANGRDLGVKPVALELSLDRIGKQLRSGAVGDHRRFPWPDAGPDAIATCVKAEWLGPPAALKVIATTTDRCRSEERRCKPARPGWIFSRIDPAREAVALAVPHVTVVVFP